MTRFILLVTCSTTFLAPSNDCRALRERMLAEKNLPRQFLNEKRRSESSSSTPSIATSIPTTPTTIAALVEETQFPSLQELQNLNVPETELEKLHQLIQMRERLDHGDTHCTRALCNNEDENQPCCTQCKIPHCHVCAKYPKQHNLPIIITTFWKRYQRTNEENI